MEFTLSLTRKQLEETLACMKWRSLKRTWSSQHHGDVSSLLLTTGAPASTETVKNTAQQISGMSCLEDVQQELETMVQRLEDEYLPRVFLFYERHKFFSHSQDTKDHVCNFVTELKCLAKWCHFQKDKENLIARQIRNGVGDSVLRQKLQDINDAVPSIEPLCVSSVMRNESYSCPIHRYVQGKEVDNTTSVKEPVVFHEKSKTFTNIDCSYPEVKTRLRSKAVKCQKNDIGKRCRRMRSAKNVLMNKFNGKRSEEASGDISGKSKENQNINTKQDTANGIDKLTLLSDSKDIKTVSRKSVQTEGLSNNHTSLISSDTVTDDYIEDKEHVSYIENASDALTTQKSDKRNECSICGSSYATATLLKCHMRTHSDQKQFTCDVCNTGFVYSRSRTKHMRLCHPEVLQFQCDQCPKSFEHQKGLEQHQLYHWKQTEITCTDCGMVFQDTRSHYTHQRQEHRKTRYSCNKCSLYFSYPSKLKLHLMSRHNATKPFVCEICGNSFSERSLLTKHRVSHTGDRHHKCTTCGRGFLLKSTLSAHLLTHLAQKVHTCDICGLSFKLASYLKSHQKTHSKDRARPHTCSTCSASFLKLYQLKNHDRRHTGEKPFKCCICDMLFTQASSLKKHIQRIHEGLRPKEKYSCEKCGLGFTHLCKLKLHQMKHTGERPFGCQHCGASYRERHQLHLHLKTHSGQEPHMCSLCGQRFLQKSHLEAHVRRHTGEKPFSCTICGARFALKGYLRDHMKTHDTNRERKYKCGICDKAFTCSSHMRSHEHLHSGDKPHVCLVCGASFTKRSSMKKHLTRFHRVKDTLAKSEASKLMPAQNETSSSPSPVKPTQMNPHVLPESRPNTLPLLLAPHDSRTSSDKSFQGSKLSEQLIQQDVLADLPVLQDLEAQTFQSPLQSHLGGFGS